MLRLRQTIGKYFIISSALLTSQTTKYLNQNQNISSSRPMSSTDFSIAFVTAPNNEVAKTIAQKLVENRLSACVNIIPSVLSVYEWKGKIETDSEVLMIIKTRTSRVEELTSFVKDNHPYEVCEVITFPIQSGNMPYLKWLGEAVPQ